MNLGKVLSDEELAAVVNVEIIEGVRARRKALEFRRDELREQVERNPMICDEVKKDWRYKLGQVAMASEILDLPQAAQDALLKRERNPHDPA